MELPVTLIVKAPNQQIEDQTVQCQLSWTINMLKQHLSEVYPSKPPKNEQKLIYSGKLLNDGVVLKDILRQYEGQDTHTVHLVCTPKYSPKAAVDVARTTRPEPPPADAPPSANVARPDAADQRVPDMQWYDDAQFNNVQPHVDPQMMHMFMMQQQFMMQAYYTQYQYMNMNLRRNYTTNAPDDQQPPAQAPPPPAPPAAAAANLPRDNNAELLHRDWLDVFYMLSRTMIFISIVYFYSSPVRCLVVVALAFSLYLYQVGFFRNANINNNNIVDAAPTAAAAVAAADDALDAGQPSRLMVLWTFFTTFFASLLPEIPNVV